MRIIYTINNATSRFIQFKLPADFLRQSDPTKINNIGNFGCVTEVRYKYVGFLVFTVYLYNNVFVFNIFIIMVFKFILNSQ